jgi:hypothetical protein
MEMVVKTLNARLWEWLDRNISHLWKRYKAVVVITPRAGYTRRRA